MWVNIPYMDGMGSAIFWLIPFVSHAKEEGPIPLVASVFGRDVCNEILRGSSCFFWGNTCHIYNIYI